MTKDPKDGLENEGLADTHRPLFKTDYKKNYLANINLLFYKMHTCIGTLFIMNGLNNLCFLRIV